MVKKKNHIETGSIYKTNQCGDVEVLSLNKKKVVVKFLDTGSIKEVDLYALLKGSVADPKTFIGKVTEEIFIEHCKKYFPEYDYSTTKFTGIKGNVEIVCPKHGLFVAGAELYKRGLECKVCSLERRTANQTSNIETFIRKAREVHGDRYSYEKAIYTTARKKMIITCPAHGDFEQVAHSHLIGKTCRKCRDEDLRTNRRATKEHFIKRSEAVHGFHYTYDKVKYYNAKTKVIVTCWLHGDFKVVPDAHWAGSGCPECFTSHGFNQTSEGYLYILKSEDITKIGISNYGDNTRLKQINKSSGKNFEKVVQFYDKNGRKITDVETILLKTLRSSHKSPTEKFDGFTECFYNIDLDWLTELAKSELEKYG